MPISMDKYSSFETEDFILDDFFIHWVFTQEAEDDKIWTDWLLKYPEQEEKIKQAKSIARSIRFNKVNEIDQSEIDTFISRVKHTYQQPRPQVTNWIFAQKWLAVAASLILLLSFATYIYVSSKKELQNTPSAYFLQAHNEGLNPILIHLQDGTAVILKPGSYFKYPKSFSKASREVFLNGEAFFEVHKNPKQPFLIHTEDMTTRVLGTSFTIRAYKNEQRYKVVVNTGRVEVYTGSPNVSGSARQAVVLWPNEQVTYQKGASKLLKERLKQPAPLSEEVTNKSFSFNNVPVEKVFQTLTDAYGIRIIYDEKIFSTCAVTAKLYSDNVYEKLNAICKAIDASFKVENGNIVITGKGCAP